jgi:hypothetical protein
MRPKALLNAYYFLQQYVDGLLRMGVVLKTQLNTNSNEIDDRLLHQNGSNSKFSERWVINQARNLKVIPSALSQELHALYDSRNKCVHTYIISDVNYDFATQLVIDYNTAIEAVRSNIKVLEQRQAEAGIGLVAAQANTEDPDYDREIRGWIREMAISKEQRPKGNR